MTNGKILVADDEAHILHVVSMKLANAGYEVLTAVDGEEAVRIASDPGREITCVILDLTMPRMNGAVAFERLQALRTFD